MTNNDLGSFRGLPDRFLVAFSFADEQRELVRAIAEAVEARLGSGTVFLDEWFEHYLAGDDADLKLQENEGVRSRAKANQQNPLHDPTHTNRIRRCALSRH